MLFPSQYNNKTLVHQIVKVPKSELQQLIAPRTGLSYTGTVYSSATATFSANTAGTNAVVTSAATIPYWASNDKLMGYGDSAPTGITLSIPDTTGSTICSITRKVLCVPYESSTNAGFSKTSLKWYYSDDEELCVVWSAVPLSTPITDFINRSKLIQMYEVSNSRSGGSIDYIKHYSQGATGTNGHANITFTLLNNVSDTSGCLFSVYNPYSSSTTGLTGVNTGLSIRPDVVLPTNSTEIIYTDNLLDINAITDQAAAEAVSKAEQIMSQRYVSR